MKKLLASILAFVLLLSLSGCASTLNEYQGPWYNEIGYNSQHTGSIDTKDFNKPEIVWEYQIPNSYTSSAPIVVNNKIYFTTADGYIYCIKESSTKTVWKYRAEASFTSSPIYHNGVIYAAATDSYVYAVDAEKGDLIWFQSVNEKSSDEPIQIEVTPIIAGDNIIVGTGAGTVRAFSLEDGLPQWKYTVASSTSSAPISTDLTYYDYGDEGGVVYFGSDDTYFYALNAKTGKFMWSHNTSTLYMQPATAYDGHVYLPAGNGRLYKFEALTGNIVWEFTPDHNVYFAGYPAIKDGKLVIGCYDYATYCVDIETGEKVWKSRSWGWLQSPATIVGNSVLICGAGDTQAETHFLFCLDFDTGNVRWYTYAEETVRTAAVVLDGVIFFMDEGGRLLKLE